MADDDLDLGAWQVPAPPPGLADAVIARMRAPVATAAIDPVPRASWRWWLAGAAIVAAAATSVTIVLVTRARAEDRAQEVELEVAKLRAELNAQQERLQALQHELTDVDGHAVGGAPAMVPVPPAPPTPPRPPVPAVLRPPAPVSAPVPTPACDAEALRAKGAAAASAGLDAQALVAFEQASQCKADPYLTKLMFMESCKSKNMVKAKRYFKQLSASDQTTLVQICVRVGIDL